MSVAASPTRPLAIFKLDSTFPELSGTLGDFEDWFQRATVGHGMPVQIRDARDEHALPEPALLAGAILTGSACMVTARLPWSERLRLWLRRAVEAGLPVLGVCYGHQLLADALGGSVAARREGAEIGTISVARHATSDNDPLFAGLPQQFFAQSVHWQSVTRLPDQAVLLAGSEADPHQAYRVGENAWGVQFHPEFPMAAMRFYIETYQDTLRKEGQDPFRLGRHVQETPEAAGLLPAFARVCNTRLLRMTE
ncbi:glutamine amidotransferase [Paraburkholderia acidipaludis]|uniref:glutamine amidotransferase n=1 Tax=Paraburkholderia acidipaludis TaxID=660537 RepID=UPI0004812D9B|nr:glutamine amidotransferase [Paraburkholderia acidipaludis]